MKKYDKAELLILLHAHRREFLDACEQMEMSDADAHDCLFDFEHEELNYAEEDAHEAVA